MSLFTDQTGKTIRLDQPPCRIVSLVPSQTELLFDLGLEQEVVGITKFCIHPASWHQAKVRVGGTKQVDLPLVRNLQPDLIIANKEENVREQVQELERTCPVWTSDVSDLQGALNMIRTLGQITRKQNTADDLIETLQQAFADLPTPTTKRRALYLIWREPWMTVGGDTFIHDMLERAGFANCFAGQNRYPVIDDAQIQKAGPEVVLLSSEPYPFREKHLSELSALLPGVAIHLVNGEPFSWYGSRMRLSPDYFRSLQRLFG